ncbi:rhomboid family intramembrane serine protease [Nonlabens ponticola]|uniref:Rhomboid family intramembrane serine protease n=1 Tax=Nonlabens ponticola TaxID=2496866 RepID=A0A3S9MYL9_9FLAO|nr:rhomboid family intramembrane serine protease [Nonlabens ponticola]AZQ44258.1 rhomboid family intramembrane serine protease [Nonlabens ponticola]
MFSNIDLVTIVIIGVTCLVSFKGFQDFVFFDNYKFNIGGIQRGEQYRFFSSGFLHLDIQHLLFNMLTLYFFAWIVIESLGTIPFLIVYLVSMLGGNLLSYLFHKDEYQYSAIGASGAVSGIIYAGILLFPEMMIYGIIPGYIFGIGYLIYTIYGIKNRIGNIGHDAHFGGAATGYAITLIYDPQLIFQETLIVVALLIPIIILFILMKLGKI